MTECDHLTDYGYFEVPFEDFLKGGIIFVEEATCYNCHKRFKVTISSKVEVLEVEAGKQQQ
jgi:hypothetical protein